MQCAHRLLDTAIELAIALLLRLQPIDVEIFVAARAAQIGFEFGHAQGGVCWMSHCGPQRFPSFLRLEQRGAVPGDAAQARPQGRFYMLQEIGWRGLACFVAFGAAQDQLVAGAGQAHIEQAGFIEQMRGASILAAARGLIFTETRRQGHLFAFHHHRKAIVRQVRQVNHWKLQTLASMHGHHSQHLSRFTLALFWLAAAAAIGAQFDEDAQVF